MPVGASANRACFRAFTERADEVIYKHSLASRHGTCVHIDGTRRRRRRRQRVCSRSGNGHRSGSSRKLAAVRRAPGTMLRDDGDGRRTRRGEARRAERDVSTLSYRRTTSYHHHHHITPVSESHNVSASERARAAVFRQQRRQRWQPGSRTADYSPPLSMTSASARESARARQHSLLSVI